MEKVHGDHNNKAVVADPDLVVAEAVADLAVVVEEEITKTLLSN